jgi:phosphopentomutase
MEQASHSLIFTNLVDFDMNYGHRRNPQGYADCLKEFDLLIPEIKNKMSDEDLLIITADHGNDPTFKGTDHTREYVPVLAYSKKCGETDLGSRSSFADVGKTILDFFGIQDKEALKLDGESFLSSLNYLK